MGSFPHEYPGYRHVATTAVRELFEDAWGVPAPEGTGPSHSKHVRSRHRRQLQGPVRAGRGHRAVGSEHAARDRGAHLDRVPRGAGHLHERDGALRPRVPAGRLVSREGRHVHQRGTPHLARAQGHASAFRQGRLGRHGHALQRAGIPDELPAPVGDHGRDRAAYAHVQGRELREAGRAGLDPMALQRCGAQRHADHAHRQIRAREGPLQS